MIKKIGTVPIILPIILFFCAGAFGWGRPVHYYINYEGANSVPADMAAFRHYAPWLASHASDVDYWKGYLDDERYRHYIDLDRYGEYPFRDLPQDLGALIREHGRKEVLENGIIPWTIERKYHRMVDLMKTGKWEKVMHVAAALGHYVADAHQPFHSTDNYDGQKTGNNGIHSRYESEMTYRYLDYIKRKEQIPYSKGALTKIRPPLDVAFEYLVLSYGYIDIILEADTKHKKHLKDDEQKYYKLMWQDTGAFTVDLINKAADDLALLYYAAWIEAGMPKIPEMDTTKFTKIKNKKHWQDTFYGTDDFSKVPGTFGVEENKDPKYRGDIMYPAIIP